MYYLQNRLYAPSLTECKAIYRGGEFLDVQVEVDITSINPNGLLDSGIYVQASKPGKYQDQITAWCVNLEREVNGKYYKVKLHRFENNFWKGVQVETKEINVSDTYRLKVVVLNGVLYAYVDDGECLFTYYIGNAVGKVGLRAFYAPNYFTNFSVTAPNISLNTNLFQQKIEQLEKLDLDLYTTITANNLKTTLEKAKNLINGEVSQPLLEICYLELIKAENALIKLCTKEDLVSLVEIGKNAQQQTNVYTKNSISSLKVVLENCQKAIESENIQEISYWYQKLEYKLDTLIKYGG